MTASSFWHWLIHTDAGLLTRVACGAAIFLFLALNDLRRNGRQATRWREYLFLLAVVGVSLLYGVANDQITSRISWEYFYYGKGLSRILGPQTPPNMPALHWEATKVGLKATWSAGLIVGVAILIANNPSRTLPQLAYRRLWRYVPTILLCCAFFGSLLGGIGYEGFLVGWSPEFQEMLRRTEFRPRLFMAVYGTHLGGYLGGMVGTIIAVISIRRSRKIGVPDDEMGRRHKDGWTWILSKLAQRFDRKPH
jgi:hypothetical protein